MMGWLNDGMRKVVVDVGKTGSGQSELLLSICSNLSQRAQRNFTRLLRHIRRWRFAGVQGWEKLLNAAARKATGLLQD